MRPSGWSLSLLILLNSTGDFLQLPPVPDEESDVARFAFDANMWDDALPHTFALTKVYRQTANDLIRHLNQMRIGRVDDEGVKFFQSLAHKKWTDGIVPTKMSVLRSPLLHSLSC